MTIALGILAADGVVIAADTQETYGLGFAKYDTRKIMSARQRSGAKSFAATGGGDGAYLDSLFQDYVETFEAVDAPADIQRGLQDRLSAFYADHLFPFKGRERPDVGSVIGMSWRGRQPLLLASRLNRFRRCKLSAADGAGREHATYLLSRLWASKHNVTVLQAASVAAFVISHVKEYVDGTGRSTHVTVLRDGGAWYVKPEVMKSLEQQYAEYLESDVSRIHRMLGVSEGELTDSAAGLAVVAESSLIQTEGEAVFD